MGLRFTTAIAITLNICFYALINNANAQDPTALEGHMAMEARAFPEFRTGRDLRREAASASGDVVVGFRIMDHEVQPPPGGTVDPYQNPRIKSLISRSDLIVVATVTGKITALTADSSFVFSHYDSSIDTTLFDRRPLLTSRGTFYVTTPGGEVLIDGHMVRASVSNIPQLSIGKRYLLFLVHDSSSDSFHLLSDSIVLELTGDTFVPVGSSLKAPNAALLGDGDAYLDAIRANVDAIAAHSFGSC
jgi:hypothetical protein